jgi:F-type H+-transporting ATPase subunit c
MKKLTQFGLVVLIMFLVAAPAFAVELDPNGAAKAEQGKYVAIAMGFGLGFAAAFGALGQAKAIAAAVESIARQPEAAGNIRGALIIGLALIETLVIYMLLICFFLNGKVQSIGS